MCNAPEAMLFILMKLSIEMCILNYHWCVQQIDELNISIVGLRMQKMIEHG